MAFTFVIITALVTAIVHGNPEIDDDFEGFGPSMMFHYEPALPLPPLPYLPGMSRLPPMPSPPPLLVFGPKNFFRGNAARLPPVKFPTIEEIISETPQDGGTLSAVAISSKASGTRKSDGKVVWEGGSTMINNDNGKVTVTKFGDTPPDIEVATEPPFPDFPEKNFMPHPPPPPPIYMNRFQPFEDFEESFNSYKPHKQHKFKSFKPFKPFKSFEPHKFKKFDAESMKNYVPKEGETYAGVSISTHTSSSNINGVEKSSGSMSALSNLNGKVEEKKVAFKKGDPEP